MLRFRKNKNKIKTLNIKHFCVYIQTIRKTEQNETNLFTRRGENLLQKKNKTKQKHSMEVYSVPNDFFNDYFLESLLEK